MAEIKKTKEYDDQSITSLKGADRVRKRPSVIFGSDGLEGCEHSFFEILANSADEARAGYGDRIVVTVYHDCSIEVEDFGRGVPLGYNEKEGRWNWELVFCELYAGGKYDTNSDGSAYKYSLGLNGLGACATQYCSEYMTVRSFSGRKKELSEIDFRGGEPASELRVRPIEAKDKKKTGTIIRWKPDGKVFTDIRIPFEFYDATLRRQAVVNAGVHFILRVEEDGKLHETEYYYEGGVAQYVEEMAGVDALGTTICWHMNDQRGRDAEDREEYTVRADIAFCTMQRNGRTEYFHNSSFLEYGGSPDKATRTAFTYAVDKFLKQQNKYNKNEAKITFADIADSLFIVISSSSTVTSYENQTKKAISNAFITRALTDFMKARLDYYFIENPTAGAAFANAVLVNKRAREKAEVTVTDIKKKLSAGGDAALSRVEKFVACRSKDPSIRELYIVEGDSALTSCKLGRNAEFQAIIPVRGKTLNCLKASYDRIFESPIIVDLLRVIGCGVELGGKKLKGDISPFNYEALRWSKIILCTDADEDGFQIRTLLLTMFYRLLPTLLAKEKVFIAESPLFEITCGDDTYFAYNEPEKLAILKELGDRKYILQRSKGLGENEPEMMWKTTMNPASRRLIAVTPADAEQTAWMFDTLLGDSIAERKQFIAENGARYMADADV
jgi:DNA gyrase subunit B